jgi:uncharacterized protein YegJ (DUF2314 family)
MAWIVIGVLLALVGGAGGLIYWRTCWRRRPRMISFVGLTKEPRAFDPAVLARLAGKAWNAELGDGSVEGPDGFVAGAGVTSGIMHDGRMFVVNSFPVPYVEDADKVAKSIRDLRIRSLFAEHRAWFSCDVIGINRDAPEEEVLDAYRRLGRLFVELLDENCLLLYLPDSELAYPVNEETEASLRSPDPLAALRQTSATPVVEIADDDPRMKKAVETARRTWPQFVAAYDARAGEHFTVKAPVTAGERTEFIWIDVTCIEGDRIYGTLGNDPFNLGPLKLGSKVSVEACQLNDWMYLNTQEEMVGGFTVKVVQDASSPGRAV